MELSDASLRFGDQRIYERINLHLPTGSFSALLGGSGVGKTSLLRQIASLPISHTAQFDGTVCGGAPDDIAWMAQQDLLLPWLTVFENVTVGCKLRHQHLSDDEQQRAASILQRVGLADKADALPQQLSGGQRQRVALARTFFEDRSVVLMDEPFSAVDAITRRQLQDLACELLRGKTVLLITHDPMEAIRMANYVLVMHGQPATLTTVQTLNTATPRDVESLELMQLHNRLLTQLAQGEVSA